MIKWPLIILTLALGFSCDENKLRDSRPTDSGEGLDGYLAEEKQDLPARTAVAITFENTEVKIDEDTTNADSIVRLRALEEPPTENEAADIGMALGDVVNIEFLTADESTSFDSSLLDNPFTISQRISGLSVEADLKMIVITDPGQASEDTKILGYSSMSVSADDELGLLVSGVVSIKAMFTSATFWIVESKSVPSSIKISSIEETRSKGAAVESDAEEVTETVGPAVLRLAIRHLGVLKILTIKDGQVKSQVANTLGNGTFSLIYRDGQVPDVLSLEGESDDMIITRNTGPSAWSSVNIAGPIGGAPPMRISAVATGDDTFLAFHFDTSGNWVKTLEGSAITGASHGGVDARTGAIDLGDVAALGDRRYVYARTQGSGDAVLVHNAGDALLEFKPILTDEDPNWVNTAAGGENLSGELVLRPIDENSVMLASTFIRGSSTIHAGVVVGNVVDASHSFYDLGIAATGSTLHAAVNAVGDIVVIRITPISGPGSFDGTLRIVVSRKLSADSVFSEIGEIRGDSAVGCEFASYKVGIDNGGNVHLFFTAGEAMDVFYQRYEGVDWTPKEEIYLTNAEGNCSVDFSLEDLGIDGAHHRGTL